MGGCFLVLTADIAAAGHHDKGITFFEKFQNKFLKILKECHLDFVGDNNGTAQRDNNGLRILSHFFILSYWQTKRQQIH